ncbi:MAG: phosphodiester glycosidase family protein [Flavobacteriales bacterium]|nr:MAG: phosphodiester glycosidase family protein [Flavobacteriales bacterium]
MRALLWFSLALLLYSGRPPGPDDRIASVVFVPDKLNISMHWRDAEGKDYRNIGRLKSDLEQQGRTLLFAMNGGMYTPDHTPVGLYVESGTQHHKLNTGKGGTGNFSMQPNGVFGVHQNGRAEVITTDGARMITDWRCATQSGPMLVIDGSINAQFTPGSKNVNIRNGVGTTTDGRVVFAISREPVNFHDFARFFLDQGCANALYLDGAVSRAYMPEAGLQQLDGDLGVLIAVVR